MSKKSNYLKRLWQAKERIHQTEKQLMELWKELRNAPEPEPEKKPRYRFKQLGGAHYVEVVDINRNAVVGIIYDTVNENKAIDKVKEWIEE